MTDAAQQMLAQALRLSTQERAELIDSLIRSVADDGVLESMDPEILDAWRAEVRRRAEALDRGETELLDGEQVFEALYEKYGA